MDVMVRHRFAAAPVDVARVDVTSVDVAFSGPAAGVTVLFGPSGAGKSTVLAGVAGLLRPDACRVRLGDAVLADSEAGVFLPPEARGVGVVFQDARLFPHLRVRANLNYGLRRARVRRIAFDDVVDLLQLEGLLDRRVHGLSGGERQRVAIGRALLGQPRLLLMDEPLASLDAAHKAEILPFIAGLRTALLLPVLYVTHAMDELVRLADHVVLIEAGRVVAQGKLGAMAARGDIPLALRDDAGAVLDAVVVAQDAARQLTRLEAGGMAVLVPLIAAPVGAAVRVRVPAREVILARAVPAGISVQNVLTGVVRRIVEDAARHTAMVEVSVGESALLARVTPDAVARLGLSAGAAVVVMFKSVGVEVAASGADPKPPDGH